MSLRPWKVGQGHPNWHEQAKLQNGGYHHAKFDRSRSDSDQENFQRESFLLRAADQSNTNHTHLHIYCYASQENINAQIDR